MCFLFARCMLCDCYVVVVVALGWWRVHCAFAARFLSVCLVCFAVCVLCVLCVCSVFEVWLLCERCVLAVCVAFDW